MIPAFLLVEYCPSTNWSCIHSSNKFSILRIISRLYTNKQQFRFTIKRMTYGPPAAGEQPEGSEEKMSSPPIPVLATTPKTGDGGEISPLGPAETANLSRLSQFDFGFDNNLASPTAYDRRPFSASQPTLMLNGEPQSSSPPPRPISTSHIPLPASSSRPPLQPLTETTEEEEAPPPYTTFGEYNGRITSDSPQPSAPIPAHTRPKRGGRTAFFHQQVSTSEIPGGQRMSTLTLDDLRSEGRRRKDAEARWRRHEAKQQWTWMWRGPQFFPTGGHSGIEQGLVRTEKHGMTRTRKWCLVGCLIVIVLVAAIIGGVVGGRSKSQGSTAQPESASSLENGPPTIPLGTVVVRPFRSARLLSTCVAKSYIWSCVLPPDTKFPITSAINDNFRVPEFRFIIKRRSQIDASGMPESEWLPVPRNIPNTTDYESISSVDGVKDVGEETDFYITLATIATSAIVKTKELHNDSNINNENNRAAKETIREESHMLPSVLKNQPLRLFDRGLDTEHYGFHIYFDKSVQFVNNTRPAPSQDTGGVSANSSGFRIMWNKTRFKVTIFTKVIGKIVETMADTELDLPVDIWEDRVGGDGRGRTISTFQLDKNGVPGVQRETEERGGVNTEKRGCFCHWSNYKASSKLRL